MTRATSDPQAVESVGRSVMRWGISGSLVAAAYAGVVWWALVIAPEGAEGAPQQVTLIDLEPVTMDAPPPAPEPVVQPKPEPEIVPPEPVAEPPPEAVPPPPEPVVQPEPALPEPVLPEPAEPPPPVEEPPPVEPPPPEVVEPVPEPEEIMPDLPEQEEAAAVLNAPIPMARPTPPRPRVEQVRPRTERPRRVVEEKPRPVRREVVRPRQQQRSTAPRSDTRAAQRTASAPSVSPARWQSQVVSKIRRSGRRLSGSPSGTAQVTFSVSRSGSVTSARLSRSSGSPELDREAVAAVRRASPMPAPPAGLSSGQLTMMVPINAR